VDGFTGAASGMAAAFSAGAVAADAAAGDVAGVADAAGTGAGAGAGSASTSSVGAAGAAAGTGTDVSAPSAGIGGAAAGAVTGAAELAGAALWRVLTGMRLLPSAYNNCGALLAQPASSNAITTPAVLIMVNPDSGEIKKDEIAALQARDPAIRSCWLAAVFSAAPP
jgi:hypothetical protein